MYQLAVKFIIFIIFSFLGWLSEVIYCSIGERKLVNRGFLNGPICPVYGFGGLLVVNLLWPYSGNPITLFFLGFILTSLLEYMTSYILEKSFDTKLWDYSHYKFNINGRVCLLNSTFFGVMSIVAVDIVYPIAYGLVESIPEKIVYIIFSTLLIILVSDLTITVLSMNQLNGRLKRLEKIYNDIREKLGKPQFDSSFKMKEALNELRTKESHDSIEESIINLIEKLEHIQKDNKFLQRRLLIAFPKMKSNKYEHHLNDIKEELKRLKEKRIKCKK